MNETLRYHDVVIAKEHTSGRAFRAIVMVTASNEVLWRAPIIGWTKGARSLCREWIESNR